MRADTLRGFGFASFFSQQDTSGSLALMPMVIQSHTWKENVTQHSDPTLSGPRPSHWWTGANPQKANCPGLDANGVLRSLPMPMLRAVTRQALRDYFENGWALTETLFASLQGAEAFYRPPHHGLRHPLIFYYAHPAVFYVNKLRLAGFHNTPLCEEYEHLFEVGVDEMRWDDMSPCNNQWPSVAEVRAYRGEVYARVMEAIDTSVPEGETRSIAWDDPAWALVMGFEHERIHLETSSVLIRELPLSLVRHPESWPAPYPASSPQSSQPPQTASTFRPHPGGAVVLGKPNEFPSYGWDNEYGTRNAQVRPFEAGESLVSNAEFYAFVLAGGYREREYWTEEGWAWRSFCHAKRPPFWVCEGPEGLHAYALRTCFSQRPMPWDWPVVVNAHEANAYAHWFTQTQGDTERPYRLVTEAEHWLLRNAATREASSPKDRDFILCASGAQLHQESGPNINLAHGSEGPSTAFAATDAGFRDVLGNVWEWCEDHQHPLEGFRVHPYYDDFTAPCFRGEHTLIHVGSFVSTGNQASIWGRYQFRPHFAQQAGFRLVRAQHPGVPSGAVRLNEGEGQDRYETDALLDQYMTLHFGSPEDTFPWNIGIELPDPFPVTVAKRLVAAAQQHRVSLSKTLDVGCAVGASTFELARHCPDCLGVDLSARFIEVAQRLTERGSLPYQLRIEGELTEPRTLVISPEIDRTRTRFRRADACALPLDFQNFVALIAANLVCRLPSPTSFLGRLAGPCGLVRPGGLLLLTTPFTWREAHTPKGAWLGGKVEQGKPVWSLDGLKDILSEHFTLLEEDDVPLIIREHRRKYELIVAAMTIWQRNL